MSSGATRRRRRGRPRRPTQPRPQPARLELPAWFSHTMTQYLMEPAFERKHSYRRQKKKKNMNYMGEKEVLNEKITFSQGRPRRRRRKQRTSCPSRHNARCADATQAVSSSRPSLGDDLRGGYRRASWRGAGGLVNQPYEDSQRGGSGRTLCAAFECSYTPPKNAVVASLPMYLATR
jgi:hypothetical protein